MFLVPLLVGLDGKQKMSQSLGNFIAVDDPPHDMYGKLMSIPDSLVMDYFETLTDSPDGDLASIKQSVESGGQKAMDAKMRLAREIVTQFHGEAAADTAGSEFETTFSKPSEAEPVPLPEGTLDVALQLDGGARTHDLARILQESGAVESVSQARRLISQGAVELVGTATTEQLSRRTPERITQAKVDLRDGDVIRVGKHRFLRIVDADKHT